MNEFTNRRALISSLTFTSVYLALGTILRDLSNLTKIETYFLPMAYTAIQFFVVFIKNRNKNEDK